VTRRFWEYESLSDTNKSHKKPHTCESSLFVLAFDDDKCKALAFFLLPLAIVVT
jgi:hypothetical protein